MPKQVNELIERFDRNIESYRNQAYNETQVRREFVDPFFEALGWDVTNRAGYAEAYKDAIHEDAIKIGSATKAPDYCFRIGGVRKFFVETKKPAINVKEDISPAYQLRRYAWSAKLPLSILTDFEEFAVYDCRISPKPTDKPAIGRILYLTYKDYADHWGEITSIFSKEAVLRGSFDRFAESGKGKRGTSLVDAEFLTEIESWRETLARNLALRNADLTVHDLNFAVQRTIDRIIFLRMCEDRGIEPYGQLQSLLNGENVYDRLRYLYGLADDRYNSGLFHFKPEKGRAEAPDGLTPTLTIDDKVLKDIIRRLYYPESPYEFSVLSADILGNVYEQFLGKVIRLTAGHRAVIEEKPEVKKAGGVYYTPAYIVDYIVKNTVGKIVGTDLRVRPDMLDNDNKGAHIGAPLQGMTPKQISKIRILDPACGSGSFLIGAYTYLLNYHRDWYVKDSLEKHTKEIYQGAGGQWLLTSQEKKRILLNNIYGVDIDSQAIEVTKLSLLLKVLEGENQETISKQLKMWRERALPDLGNNIKCGNSLIGPDYWEGKQMAMFDDEEARRVNAFDWKAEFPAIFPSTSRRGKGEGGFDAVIGNPPYIQLSMMEYYDDLSNEYISRNYTSSMGRLNTFGLFVERALSLMLRRDGYLSYIVPNTLLTQEYYQELRQKMLQYNLMNITTYQHPVFSDAVVETTVFVLQKSSTGKNRIEVVYCNNKAMTYESRLLSQNIYENTHANAFLVNVNSSILALKAKLEKTGYLLKDVANINQAIALKHDRSKSLFQEKKASNFKRVLDGRNIQRYSLEWPGFYLAYDVRNIHSCKRTDIFEAEEKIFFRRVGDRLIAAYDDQQYYALNTLVVITSKNLYRSSLRYLLGLINSRLLNFYYITYLKSTKKVFSEIQARQLAQIPVRDIDFSNPADKTRHDKMVTLVDRMLDLHKRLPDAKTPDDKTQLQRQINATDRQIDQLVYELYGLTEKEVRIVGEAVKK